MGCKALQLKQYNTRQGWDQMDSATFLCGNGDITYIAVGWSGSANSFASRSVIPTWMLAEVATRWTGIRVGSPGLLRTKAVVHPFSFVYGYSLRCFADWIVLSRFRFELIFVLPFADG